MKQNLNIAGKIFINRPDCRYLAQILRLLRLDPKLSLKTKSVIVSNWFIAIYNAFINLTDFESTQKILTKILYLYFQKVQCSSIRHSSILLQSCKILTFTLHNGHVNYYALFLFSQGTCINNTSVMMFKKGSFEIGGTIYPVAIKVVDS